MEDPWIHARPVWIIRINNFRQLELGLFKKIDYRLLVSEKHYFHKKVDKRMVLFPS